ncbi:MAG: hypothetical protein WHX52_07920 [Anaerolineae bacterium]
MIRWIQEWVILSMLAILAAGTLFVLWVIWPLLPGRLPVTILPTLNLEGVVSILMLLVIITGFGKLLCSK